MKLNSIILEANVAAKIGKDPKLSKMLLVAMRHDGTLPKTKIAALGPRPSDQDVIKLWSDLLDDSLRSSNYGDLSADGKFDDWLTRLYINGVIDFEDLSGEGVDALGAWKALSIRGRLKPEHQDFNKFKTIKQIQAIVRNQDYRDELRRIKDAEVIEKHKREKKEIALVDNDRFLVTMPFNYGACYTFNNAAGYQSNFCTGSSQGLSWFQRYAPDGPIISVVDKENMGTKDGKWQIHAPTNQIVDSDQTRRHDREWNDQRFAELFPGLMKEIVSSMMSHAEEIQNASVEIAPPNGYDVQEQANLLKTKYPLSYASGSEEEQPEPEPTPEPEPQREPEPEANAEDQPMRTFRVTQLASGRSANIEGRDLEHVQQRVLQRYPGSSIDDYSWEAA